MTDHKAHEEMPTERDDQTDCSLAILNQDSDESQREPGILNTSVDDRSNGTDVDKASMDDSGSDHDDEHKGGRPMSPGTLALMCDEQDTLFMTSQNNSTSSMFLPNQNVSEVYVEQERQVLMGLRDRLQRFITCGKIKGKPKYSAMCMRCDYAYVNYLVTGFLMDECFPKYDATGHSYEHFTWFFAGNIQKFQTGFHCIP